MVQSNHTMLELIIQPQLAKMVLSREVAIVFSADMSQILWANVPGLDMLGVSEFTKLAGTGSLPQQSFIRQLAGAARQVDGDHAIVRGFRISRGTKSEFIQCELSQISLTSGKSAILLTCSDEVLQPSAREHEFARLVAQSLAGIADSVAIIDEFGLVVGASDEFLNIEFSADDLSILVRDTLSPKNLSADRLINTLDGNKISARIVNLNGDPVRLMIVCEAPDGLPGSIEPAEDTAQNSDTSSQAPAQADTLPDTQQDSAPDSKRATRQEPQPASVRSLLDRWYSRQSDIESPTGRNNQDDLETVQQPPEPEFDIGGMDQSGSIEQLVSQEVSEEDRNYIDPVEAESDRNVVSKDQEQSAPPDEIFGEAENTPDEDQAKIAPRSQKAFHFNATGEAIRFAWKIDAGGVFRSVSPELAQTVGPNAADIVGRGWREVATVFGFDRSGEIAGMLEKRDTWSGKTVMWPVQGTDLVLPIDLAALPAFSQEREFDGFRGFGIIRTADAVVDFDEIGRALVGGAQSEGEVSSDEDIVATDGDDVVRQQQRSIDDEDTTDEPDETEGARNNGATIVDMNSRRNREQDDEPPKDESLSRREVRAFHEIGEKLGSEPDFDPTENKATMTPESVTGINKASDEIAAEIPEDLFDGAGTAVQQTDAGEQYVAYHGEVLQKLPVPVLVYRNDELLFANDELLAITGYGSLDEIAAAGGVAALISASDIDEGENPVMALTREDGSALRVNPLLQTVPWDDEKALLLTFRKSGAADSTEKAAIDIVRVSELENILDTATDGIIIAEKDGNIESLNASGEALFGIGFDDAKGKQLSEIFALESQKTIDDYISEISQPGVAGILNDGREVIGKEVNGGLIPLFVTIGKLGESEKYCVVLRDITQWKKAEEELVTAKREAENASDQKTEFLARVSHEIRTPLNAIIGFSDVMIEERFGPMDNERYREYLRDINRSGVHVLDLINDLLDISKIEAGKMELNYEAVDLNQLVSQTVALLQPQANGERIIIRTSLSRAVPKVVADVRSVRQVILNLVSNAIKFTSPNGQVIVSTVYEGNGEVGLRVRDTGRGMSPSEIEHAMKPFSQINVMDDQRGRGTGLGLPLTKALVEANRAYFDLESKPGEGTIAHVHFPTQRVLAD